MTHEGPREGHVMEQPTHGVPRVVLAKGRANQVHGEGASAPPVEKCSEILGAGDEVVVVPGRAQRGFAKVDWRYDSSVAWGYFR